MRPLACRLAARSLAGLGLLALSLLAACDDDVADAPPVVMPDGQVINDAGPDAAPDDGPIMFEPVDEVTVVSYNLFNLFDAIDDPDMDEMEFTPGVDGWGAGPLVERMQLLTRLFITMDADIVAIQEVENLAILTTLRDQIRREGGPDYAYLALGEATGTVRGMDVAVMSRFPILSSRARVVDSPYACDRQDGGDNLSGWRESRPVLQVAIDLRSEGKPDLTLLVNHWKARLDSWPCTSAEHRYRSGLHLKALMKSLLQVETRAIVALGDFNAYEFEPAINDALGARLNADALTAHDEIYDLWGAAGVIEGRTGNDNSWNHVDNCSYNYRGEWSRLDHIMVSANMRPEGRSAWRLVPGSVGTHHPNFIMDGGRPDSWSTRDGTGYSDHLPIYATFRHHAE